MNLFSNPKANIIMAIILLIIGVALPFAMMLQILPSTILLNFLAYFISITGLVLGFSGVSTYWYVKDDEDDYYKF